MSAPTFIPTFRRGGTGGTEFDDLLNQPEIRNCRLVKIKYWYLALLNGIQLEWRNPQGQTVLGRVHGDTVGMETTFPLSKAEKIMFLTGRSGNKMDALTFISNKGRSTNGGGIGGLPFEWVMDLTKYPNAALHHFKGRSSDTIGGKVEALEAVFVAENGEALA